MFSVPLKTTPKTKVKIFILLEHKSSYSPKLFNQLLYYQTLLHEQSLKSGDISLIFQSFFIMEKIPWKWAKSFQKAIYKGILDKIPAQFRKNMINYEVKLLDTHDPRLKGIFKNQRFKSRGALYLLSQIWDLKLSHSQLKEVLALFGEFSDRKNK